MEMHLPRDVKPRKTAKAGRRSANAPKRRRRPHERDDAAVRQAASHRRIRRDHSAEIAEDYVETIAQLMRDRGEARTVDIARRLGVSHVTVTKTISRLQKEGLVRSEPYRSIFLTDHGHSQAMRIEERHKLVVQFLRALGVNANDAETDAEGIEHHVSDATLAAIKRFVTERG